MIRNIIRRSSRDVHLEALGRDDQLIGLWLHGRSPRTVRAYRSDAARLIGFMGGRSLETVTLQDLQAFADSLGSLKDASRARILSAVKSLTAYAHRLGYFPVDVGAALKLPKVKDQLSERILSESEVLSMIALEPEGRNRALLRVLYSGGLRVSEVCSLTWADVTAREGGGQVTVSGKGGRTRWVRLYGKAWTELQALRGEAAPESPCFRSRKGGALCTSGAWRIVKAAAARAGLAESVSCHWLRHAHASHSLERGASVALVQATLGHASMATTGRYLHVRPGESSGRYLAG